VVNEEEIIMAAFEVSKYETDAGAVRPIRVQADTVAGDNTAPTAGAAGLYIKTTGSPRSFGIHPRRYILSREVGAVGDTTSKYARIVILSKAVFAAGVVGSTYTYAGKAWTIKFKKVETER
jgi:uncharacterized 2Fe-2S/4Fe-4S cluster protein (DUF4445 family)